MKLNRIFTVAAIAAAVALSPSVFAGDCQKNKNPTASTCSKEVVGKSPMQN